MVEVAPISLSVMEVCFSDEYDENSAININNYSVEEVESGDKLEIKSAEKMSDPLCITLVTDEQEAGVEYLLKVNNVESKDHLQLGNNEIQFDGVYIAVDYPGYCETVAQPESTTLVKGASNVPFLTISCGAIGAEIEIDAITVHHFGAGNTSDIENLYIYEDGLRISDGKTINSETGDARFSNLELLIDVGVTRELTLVGDISLDADTAAEHGFEIQDNINIELLDLPGLDGEFPIQGNIMSIGGN